MVGAIRANLYAKTIQIKYFNSYIVMILIFDSQLGGHHLEYIHHFWMGIVNLKKDEQYIIAVPEQEWEKLHRLMVWPKEANISLRLLTQKELSYKSKLPVFKRSEKESVLIAKLVREHKDIDRIILSNLAAAMPLLPLFIPRYIKVTGIIYSIDYYAKNKGLRKFRERLLLSIMARDKRFDNVLLLNSRTAPKYYNRFYKTSHFKFLVDPIPDFDCSKVKDLRKDYGIQSDSIVFLHFGVLSYRKGTIELMKAIRQLTLDRKYTFIFAGIITDEIRDEFSRLRHLISLKDTQLIIINRFLEFQELLDFCNTSDCILVPYLETECSSGVIGYGAAFGKPLIGNNDGLLGELIRENGLGFTTTITPPIYALLFSRLRCIALIRIIKRVIQSRTSIKPSCLRG